MDNFNLKKFLTENKLTKTSVLREGIEENKTYTDREEWRAAIKAKYPDAKPNPKFDSDTIYLDSEGNRVAAWSKDTNTGDLEFKSKPKDQPELIYPKGSKMDESAKEKLKAKIKEMIIAELDGAAVTDEDYDFVAEGSDDEDYEKAGREVEYGINPETGKEEFDLKDFFMDDEEELDEARVTPDNHVDYLENALQRIWNMGKGNNPVDFKDMAKSLVSDMFDGESSDIPGFEGTKDALDDLKIREAKKKDEEEAPAEEELSDEEIDTTIDTTDTGEDFNVDTSAVDPNIKAVQDALTQAQAAAKNINDDKLTQQIGNTITMFTRTHIANTEAPAAE